MLVLVVETADVDAPDVAEHAFFELERGLLRDVSSLSLHLLDLFPGRKEVLAPANHLERRDHLVLQLPFRQLGVQGIESTLLDETFLSMQELQVVTLVQVQVLLEAEVSLGLVDQSHNAFLVPLLFLLLS